MLRGIRLFAANLLRRLNPLSEVTWQMYIENGIAHAGIPSKEIRIRSVKALDDMMMILTFTSGEKRLYDATQLLQYPAFQPLRDESVFKTAAVEYGTVVWNDGEIDIAPETMYANSFVYDEIPA